VFGFFWHILWHRSWHFVREYASSRHVDAVLSVCIAFDLRCIWFLVCVVTAQVSLTVWKHSSPKKNKKLSCRWQTPDAALWWMTAIYWPDFPISPNTPLPFDALSGGIPSSYRVRIWYGKNLNVWATIWWRLHDDRLGRFGTMHQRDRHTDSHVVTASDGRNRYARLTNWVKDDRIRNWRSMTGALASVTCHVRTISESRQKSSPRNHVGHSCLPINHPSEIFPLHDKL